jgi:cellulose synthase operon protein C
LASSTVIGVPQGEHDFERQCRVLFADLLGDPHTKLVATRGKDQGGFDIIGTRDGDPDRPVGIQCKNKPKGGRLDVDGVRGDITRMLAFEPPVSEIFVVTTASDDLKYDKLALELRQTQKKQGRDVVIQIWGWDTLTIKINASAAALRAFDPDHSASTGEILRQGAVTIDLQFEQISGQREMMDTINAIELLTRQMVAPIDTASDAAVDAVLDKQIDGIRDLINKGRPKSALTLLEALYGQCVNRSAAIRSRILGNMGFAHLRLGDERRGGELLLKAHAANSDDSKAKANRVFGLLLTGDLQAAVAYGRATLADDPGNAAAAAFIYQAAAVSDMDIDPDSVITETMRKDENVGVTRTAYLRRHGPPAAWRAWATERFAAHPESLVLRRFAAEAVLDEVYERRAFSPGDKNVDDRRRMVEATAQLRVLWEEGRKHEDAAEAGITAIAHNLITAYRALRDLENADEVARQALAVAPDDDGIRIAAAHIDNIMDRHEAALSKLVDMPDGPQRTVPLLTAYAGLGRWEDMRALATTERGAALAGLDRQGFDCMAVQAVLDTVSGDDAGAAIAGFAAAWPNVLHVAATAADMAHRHAPDRFDRLFADAMLLARDEAPLSERMVLAGLAIQTERFDDAIEVLDGRVATDEPSEPLAWLALSFANAPTRPRTHEFFEALSDDVLATGRVARLAGAAEYNRGDLASAERHLRRAVRADPTDLRAHLMLQSTLQRDDRTAETTVMVRKLDEQSVNGSPLDKMCLAAALRQSGEADRALALGFDIAILNRNDEDVSAAYPHLLFMSDTPIPALGSSDIDHNDHWIDLEGMGCADIAGLITATPIPEALNFAPDHPVAKAIAGARVGDEVVLPPQLGVERRYRLRGVKHKWVWLSHQIIHDHGARFPGGTGFVEMTMQEGDVGPVLDVVRRSEDHARMVMDMYQTTAVPLAMVASLHHRDVMGLAHRIAATGGSIKTCVGLHSERHRAERAVKRARGKGAILDTYTLVVAEGLKLLPALKAHFGGLVVARSTIDEITQWRELQSVNVGRKTMQLSYEGDQAVRHVQSAEDNDQQLARLDALLGSIRSQCETRTPDGHPNVLDGQLLDAAGLGDVLDPVRIADRDGLVLISDDMHFRQLAQLGGVGAHAWLQAAALVLKAEGEMSPSEYAILTARLGARRHDFVTVDSQTLLLLLGREGDDDELAFDLAARSIGGPKADLASHADVVLRFACEVWSSPIPSWRKGRAISRLLNNLVKGRGTQTVQIVDRLEAMLAGTGRSVGGALAREHVSGWRRGHFIDIMGSPNRGVRKRA